MKGVIWVWKQPDLAESHLVRRLAAAGAPQRVYLRPGIEPPASLDVEGVEVRRIRIRSVADIPAIRTLRDALRTGRYRAIYATDTKPLANVVWAARGLPVAVVAYRGTCGLKRLDPLSWLTYRSGRVDRLVCVSEAVKDALLEAGLPAAKLTRIYKGHDPDWYRPGPRERLAEVGIPGDAFAVGCAADMRPLKGIYEMLQSLDRLPAGHPVHFLLAGRVRDPRITALAGREPYRSHIHLLGFREDVTTWMGACDAFAMPSLRSEGLPKAVIEAMSMKVPPIVTRVGGMPELVEDGVSGWVVRPDDADAMAAAIRRLYEEPETRRRLAEGARARVDAVFHLDRMVQQYQALFSSICAG